MRSPAEMQTIQVELTSACTLKCSNCTRFSGTHEKPFFISREQFHAAIDSLVDWVKEWPQGIVGFMGGEPTLHPLFAEFCEYALERIPRERLGLWSVFPDTPKHKAYREVICRTFGNILLNDHTRADILHAPVLVASEEVITKPCEACHSTGKIQVPMDAFNPEGQVVCTACNGKGKVTDEEELFLRTDRCWVQESWSASINPKGAWFCEVAASLSDLFDGPMGWEVKPGWWKHTPKDFTAQREWACRKCGAALPLARQRISQDVRDDVSPGNYDRLVAAKSRKVKRGEFVIMDQPVWEEQYRQNHGYPRQTYKDEDYRRAIAARYDIVLVMNKQGYWDPRLKEDMPAEAVQPTKKSLFSILQEA